jgi:hypothetical protein
MFSTAFDSPKWRETKKSQGNMSGEYGGLVTTVVFLVKKNLVKKKV